jgi:hypothetical protein
LLQLFALAVGRGSLIESQFFVALFSFPFPSPVASVRPVRPGFDLDNFHCEDEAIAATNGRGSAPITVSKI